MGTRLGLYCNESFSHYMKAGGFVQEVTHTTGYLVPLHEHTFVLPHSGDLHVNTMYEIYQMYSSFVRTPMCKDIDTFLTCTNTDTMFILRVMKYYSDFEDVNIFLKKNNYSECDYYDLYEMNLA